MKARWMIVLGLVLLCVACEPFLFSVFPGYLTDAAAIADVGALLGGAAVQRFDFFTLNNGVWEYAFVLATGYDGTRTLYVFDDNLAFVTSFSAFDFGSRHFVGVNNEFVIGNCSFDSAITAASIVNPIASPWGPDGHGCSLSYGSLANVFLEAGGPYLDAVAFNSSWSVVSPAPSPAMIGDGRGYQLVYTGRLFNLPTGVLFNTGRASFLGFRDWDTWPHQGFLVIYVDNQYGSFETPSPLLFPSTERLVIPLGEVAEDGSPVFAARDGIVVRGADGNMRFFGWDGQLKATTRDNGASGRVLIDFSPGDYYYVFDQTSLKLYKARNWWQKN